MCPGKPVYLSITFISISLSSESESGLFFHAVRRGRLPRRAPSLATPKESETFRFSFRIAVFLHFQNPNPGIYGVEYIEYMGSASHSFPSLSPQNPNPVCSSMPSGVFAFPGGRPLLGSARRTSTLAQMRSAKRSSPSGWLCASELLGSASHSYQFLSPQNPNPVCSSMASGVFSFPSQTDQSHFVLLFSDSRNPAHSNCLHASHALPPSPNFHLLQTKTRPGRESIRFNANWLSGAMHGRQGWLSTRGLVRSASSVRQESAPAGRRFSSPLDSS